MPLLVWWLYIKFLFWTFLFHNECIHAISETSTFLTLKYQLALSYAEKVYCKRTKISALHMFRLNESYRWFLSSAAASDFSRVFCQYSSCKMTLSLYTSLPFHASPLLITSSIFILECVCGFFFFQGEAGFDGLRGCKGSPGQDVSLHLLMCVRVYLVFLSLWGPNVRIVGNWSFYTFF